MSREEEERPARGARQGWHGWDEYAPFYDWENERTLGRRDVAFWRHLSGEVRGRVLELGCGTGRISLPLARAGVSLVGIDRSAPMIARLRSRERLASYVEARRSAEGAKAARLRAREEPARLRAREKPARLRSGERLSSYGEAGALKLVRGDIRALPFARGTFSMVLAPYGILQSLLGDRDLVAALDCVARVLATGGLFGIDLVPDVPQWPEYRDRVQLRGRGAAGARLTLVESVRQDRRRGLTTFEQRFVERRGSRAAEHRFELTFRTLSVRQMTGRLERAGFAVDAVLGDYRGRPWDARAEVWIILARRT